MKTLDQCGNGQGESAPPARDLAAGDEASGSSRDKPGTSVERPCKDPVSGRLVEGVSQELRDVYLAMAGQSIDLDPAIAQLVDEMFWELI